MAKISKTFLFLWLSSCASTSNLAVLSSQETSGSTGSEKFRALAESKYQKDVEYIYNDSRTFVVCARPEKTSALHPRRTVAFFVYDMNNDRVLFEETLADGSVVWKNDRQIEITRRTGMVKKDDDARSGYVYDVILEKKMLQKDQPVNLK